MQGSIPCLAINKSVVYWLKKEVLSISKGMSLDMYTFIKRNMHRIPRIDVEKGEITTVKGTNGSICTSTGYRRIKVNGRTLQVHQILAVAIFGDDCVGMQVNHIDGVKTNNHLDNLEWCNNSMNKVHAYTNGLKKPSPLAGKPKRPVYQIDKKTNEIVARFDSIAEAGVALGMKKPSNIITVCKGNRPYAGGYKWQYAPSKKEVMPNDVK